MWGTPVGAKFRDWMDQWDAVLESNEKKKKIEMMIDGQGLIMFFKYEGDIFGAHEGERVTFARMKNPDEEDGDEWLKDATFMCLNLSSMLNGKPEQQIFHAKDVGKLKVIDRDVACTELTKKSPKSGEGIKMATIQLVSPGDPANAEPGVTLNQGKESNTPA